MCVCERERAGEEGTVSVRREPSEYLDGRVLCVCVCVCVLRPRAHPRAFALSVCALCLYAREVTGGTAARARECVKTSGGRQSSARPRVRQGQGAPQMLQPECAKVLLKGTLHGQTVTGLL